VGTVEEDLRDGSREDRELVITCTKVSLKIF
jgi:hypothetical protein